MEIDVETVAGVASEYEKSATALADIARAVSRFAFGPDNAGRVYSDVGANIASGYDIVESLFVRWSEASMDNADRLRSTVAAYSSADVRAADRIDAAGAW